MGPVEKLLREAGHVAPKLKTGSVVEYVNAYPARTHHEWHMARKALIVLHDAGKQLGADLYTIHSTPDIQGDVLSYAIEAAHVLESEGRL